MAQAEGTLTLGEENLLESESEIVDYFGMSNQSEGWEVKAAFSRKLFLIPIFPMEVDRFSPWDTPNFKRDLPENKVESFSNLQLLPVSISRFRKGRRLNFRAETKERIEEIKLNW